MRTRAWIFGILGLLSIWSCDTASSIDPPENSFFVKFYGDNGNQEGVDAVLNVDGTMTLLGTNEVGGIKQLYLVNIEQNGNVVWESTLTTPFSAIAKDIELTNDGRLVVVANYLKSTKDIFIATFTLGGVLLDSTSTGLFTIPPNPIVPTDETVVSVTQTNDGFIVVGSTNNLDIKPTATQTNDVQDAMHVRYYDDLTLYPDFWDQTHGPGDFDSGVKIIQTIPDEFGDEQFYYFGYTNAMKTDLNFYVMRLGAEGRSNGSDDFFLGIPASDERLSSFALSPLQSGEGFVLMGTSSASGSANADIFIVKLNRLLDFNKPPNPPFQKNLAENLGPISSDKTSVFASASSGYLLLSNDKSSGVQNFYLNKIDNSGSVAWSNPIIFGGEMDDEVGAVLELPDGSIGIIGTFAIGQDGEKKMTFIKVNKEGKFSK